MMTRPAMRDLEIVLGVAAALRLLSLFTLPLIVTNDGAYYLLWGSQIAEGNWPDLPSTRTPGYPLFLALIFSLLGQSSTSVLLTQHALGVVCAACAWQIARSITNPKVAIAAGLLVGLDPWLLGLSSFALTEVLSVTLVLLSIACVLTRGGPISVTLAGALVGGAILVRPACLAWVPGLVLIAISLDAKRPRSRLLRPAWAALGVSIAVGPWLAYNASRGVPGIARTDGLALWGGMARSGLLIEDHSLPDRAPPPPAALLQPNPGERVILGYYRSLERVDGLDRADMLGEWARASIANDPIGYARAAAHAALWQSNAMIPGTPYRYDGLLWAMRRLGGTDQPTDRPPNLSTRHLPEFLDRFADDPPVGPLAWIYKHWPIGMFQCYPQLPAGVLTCLALAWTIATRRWTIAAVLASSFPIVIGHALLLQPFARYSISAWMLWWIGSAIALNAICQLAWPRAIRFVRHSVPE
ncbi:MAG: glycosyltransferase family 39 protein [Planctomycetota bacterium]